MVEVGDYVGYVFYAYREADKVGRHAGFAELLVGELAVGVACRVEHTCACVGYMGHDGYELKFVHEFDCFFACAFQSEGDYATSAVWHLLLGKVVVFVSFKTCIVDPPTLGCFSSH